MSENSNNFKSPYTKLYPAARWYAQRGYQVFPLIPGTKKPATKRGLYDATTDLAQVERWWRRWPNANIGINCGASGLLVVDLDEYKKGGSEATPLTDAELTTVTTVTAHGGTHLWYRMPEGKEYGNRRGNLPKWIDIKGHGGYVVAAPSVLVEDGRELPYAFAPGYNPVDCEIAPLPAKLVAILDAAQAGSKAPAVAFTLDDAPKPDLARWRLSGEVLGLIESGAPKGERSEADYRVILALLKAGASNDEIRGVFLHYAIGEKYGERGDKYLAHSIGRARQWLEDHPPDPSATPETLSAARAWVRGPECMAHLRASGNRRVAEMIPLLDTLAEMAQEKRVRRVQTTVRDLADHSGMSKSSAQRRLIRLADMGLIALQFGDFGTLVDLSPLLERVDLSGTHTTTVNSVPLRSTPGATGDFLTEHRRDDAFTSYPYSLAIKRRMAPTVLMQSLGASGLLLWEALDEGGTVRELAAATGLTMAAVRATLKRFISHDLVVVWQEGQAKRYWLYSDAAAVLEERREHMATFGIGQLRARRNASERADFAHRRLTGRNHLDDRQRARMEMRAEKYDGLAAVIGDSLEGMGINYRAKVMPPRPARYRIRFDAVSEWGNWAKDLWEVLRLLGEEKPLAERVRLLTLAEVGEDADAETFNIACRKVQARCEMALSLAKRRARLERWHMEDDDEPTVAAVMPTEQPDFWTVAA